MLSIKAFLIPLLLVIFCIASGVRSDEVERSSGNETVAVTVVEREPDDILNWFFHHSFKKLDQYFQSEDEL
jgi:hypothetical protein